MRSLVDTDVWRDALLIPPVVSDLAAGTAAAEQVASSVESSRRVVVTGNGAALYAGSVLAAAALEHPGPVDCLSLPAGVLATGHASLRSDDLLLVVSASGELRDVVDLLEAGLPCPWALVTATPGSTLGSAAPARLLVPLRTQAAVTHSQAYVGNVVALLALWQRVSASTLGIDIAGLAAVVDDQLRTAPDWAHEVAERVEGAIGGISFGSGGAWPAASETALLLKEVAGIPIEGMETREGATSGMYALRAGHVALSHPTRDDPLATETEVVSASTGASVIRVPGAEQLPALAAAVATFPAALALAATVGLRAGLDVDQPSWTDAYYATARST